MNNLNTEMFLNVYIFTQYSLLELACNGNVEFNIHIILKMYAT